MSAIAGAIALDGRPFDPPALDGVLRALAPLGGDGEGRWSGPVGPLGVVLGVVRRRRVAEDAADRQPVSVAGGQITVVADVVLDNRPKLCRTLGLTDRPDLADEAIVAAAYERWGDRLGEHLIGSFAAAVADGRRGGVLLIRDQIGAQPLHLFRGRQWQAFASTALALTAWDDVRREPDLDQARAFLTGGPDPDRSWIRDVVPVPAGSTVWITAAGVTGRRYWELPWGSTPGTTFEREVDELRAALDRAVADRVRRADRIGVLLDGDLDSTSVASTVARQPTVGRVATYTATGRGISAVSSRVRELVARYPVLVPAFVDVRGEAVLGDEHAWAAGSPPAHRGGDEPWIGELHRRATGDGITDLYGATMGTYGFSADEPRWLVALLKARGRVRSSARADVMAGIAATAAHAEGQAVAAARGRFRLLDPLADVRLLEVCARQPAGARRRDGLDRALARAAVADRLPETIRWQQGGVVPPADRWDRVTRARDELVAELRRARADRRAAELVDLDRWQAVLADWPESGEGGGADGARSSSHRHVLPRALVVTRYLRWLAEPARSPAAR